MTNNVIVVASLTVHAGKLEELKALVTEMCASTQTEPGTLAYEWHLSKDGARCDVYERYADSAAMMLHLVGFGKFAERFMSLVTPTSVTVYGKPDEQVRAAVAGFQPTYMTQFAGFIR